MSAIERVVAYQRWSLRGVPLYAYTHRIYFSIVSMNSIPSCYEGIVKEQNRLIKFLTVIQCPFQKCGVIGKSIPDISTTFCTSVYIRFVGVDCRGLLVIRRIRFTRRDISIYVHL